MKKLLSLLLVLCVLASCFGTAFVTGASAAIATNTDDLIVADWINADTIIDRGADNVMSEYADVGITDVYLLVKGLAGKLAWQSKVSDATMLYSSADPLKLACDAAAKYGIRVHAWMMASRDDAFDAKYPNSVAYHYRCGRESGDVNQLIDLRNETYISYMTSLIKELVANYDIAGIHFDTIRYLALYYDWGLDARTILLNDYGMTKAEYNAATLAMCVSAGYKYTTNSDGYYIYSASGTSASGVNFVSALSGSGSTDAKNGAKKFAEFRTDTVTNFVKTMKEAAGNDVIISCAIMPEPAEDSYSAAMYGQDVEKLGKVVDYVAVMSYASQYEATSTWPGTLAKKCAAKGCNAIAAIQTFDSESTSLPDPTCKGIYDEYTGVLAAREEVNNDSSYTGKVLGYSFFRGALTCLAGVYVKDSSTLNFSVHNQESTSLTKLVFAMKNGVKISGVSNKSGWGSSTFTISSDKTTLTITNSSGILGSYGSATFDISYTGTVSDLTGACMLAVNNSSGENYAYCGTRFPDHTHAYTASNLTAANCTTAGSRTLTCACGDSYIETIPATGHSYQEEYEEATLTTIYTCSVCSDSYYVSCWNKHADMETWPETGTTHFAFCYECNGSFTEQCRFAVAEQINPTCTTDGSVTYVCDGSSDGSKDAYSGSGCGNTHTEVLSASCTYSAYADNGDGSYTATCSDCGGTKIFTDVELDAQNLYFDFLNDADARERFSTSTYGYLTDAESNTSNWNHNAERNTVVLESGALTMGINALGDPYAQLSKARLPVPDRYVLNHLIREDDVVEIRVKLENCALKNTDSAASLTFGYITDKTMEHENPSDQTYYNYGARIDLDSSALTDNQYHTYIIPLDSERTLNEVLKTFRISFGNLTSMDSATNNGTVSVDYIYVGQRRSTPKQLYFDFTNDAAAQARFDSATYGYLIDAESNAAHWRANSERNAVSFGDGTLVMNVKSLGDPYVHFSDANIATIPERHVLNYQINEGDAVQIRVKFENCRKADETAPTKMILGYVTDKTADHENPSDASYYNYGAEVELTDSVLSDGEYHIYTIPLDSKLTLGEVMKAFRLNFRNLSATDTEAENGMITVDYLYIGSDYNLPTQHTFTSELFAPTCTSNGYTIYTCSTCSYRYVADEVGALGHTAGAYTNNGDGTHDRLCSVCNEATIDNEAHTYTDGICVCGAVEEEATDAGLKFKRASLTLQSDFALNFYVLDSILEGWTEPYVVFTKALYDPEGNVLGYETETVEHYVQKTTDDGYACHMFTYSGINASEMGSTVTATLYATKDGRVYKGATVNYSVLTYAKNMLAKSTDAELKTVLVDLLNYGAAAQTYFDYNTANLVNAGLTEEQKAYATQATPVLESHKTLTKNEGATVSFKTCSLLLEEKVSLFFYLNLSDYTGAVGDLEARVTYIDSTGATVETTIDSSDFEYRLYNGIYYYVVKVDTLNALQMRTVCTAEVFSKTSGERVSHTVTYSVESYAHSKAANSDVSLVALTVALMKYGDSAERYFAAD